MIDDLEVGPGVHAREVAQVFEPEGRIVVERPHDGRDVAGADPHLGLVVTLAHGARQEVPERPLDEGAEGTVHGYSWSGTVGPIARSGQWPRRSLTSCWSFIIP